MSLSWPRLLKYQGLIKDHRVDFPYRFLLFIVVIWILFRWCSLNIFFLEMSIALQLTSSKFKSSWFCLFLLLPESFESFATNAEALSAFPENFSFYIFFYQRFLSNIFLIWHHVTTKRILISYWFSIFDFICFISHFLGSIFVFNESTFYLLNTIIDSFFKLFLSFYQAGPSENGYVHSLEALLMRLHFIVRA